VIYWRASGNAIQAESLSQPQAKNAKSYTVFVQVIDEQGNKSGQIDRLPCSGSCPTTLWKPDDLIGERYEVPIATDAGPGRYRVITGMYDLVTGENLIWSDGQGRAIGSSMELGTVEVQP
jgi:hypothetical protein